jgi:SAM-dependent methyltransferase
MISARIRNIIEFHKHWDDNAHIYERIHEIEENLAKQNGREFSVKGFSYPAQCEVNFLVDYLYSDNIHINWRERVVCPKTKLNNRLRGVVHFLDFELHPNNTSHIYIAEQITPLYTYLKSKYKNIIGSEYLGSSFKATETDHRGLRHEDATRLSFADREFDIYLSFECFEYIPDYMKAFSESYRILKNGGTMLFTTHFAANDTKNIVRATMSADGTINHILPPEYNGDPVNESLDGILCFTHFGWEMMEQLKSVGFKDAYAITYWSDSLGYYDGGQFLFCAVK